MVVGSTLITRNRSCGWRIICSGLAQCKSGSGSNEENQDYGHANISKVSLGILSNDIDKRYWQIVRASHIAIQASLGSVIKKKMKPTSMKCMENVCQENFGEISHKNTIIPLIENFFNSGNNFTLLTNITLGQLKSQT